MIKELDSFIDEVYREPYSLPHNNCIHKSLKIKARAEELGQRADLIGCISIVPMKKWHNFPSINIHVYTKIEGKKVDVSLDPGHEAIYCKNSEKKLIMPVNLSRLKRIISKAINAGHWPRELPGRGLKRTDHGY
ncbi:MAG: hypothetical protein HYU83_02410 [Chloroflexi bacterium]|nr:hypothetical protein [Chloroflexota bacterium]